MLAPAIIITIIILASQFRASVIHSRHRSYTWRYKLWEFQAGYLGLILSVVSAWFITNTLKLLSGKPRPDMLSRCKPDIDNMDKYVVGGVSTVVGTGQLVSLEICKNPDEKMLHDGFRSFPSGHASFSAAGTSQPERSWT